MAILKVPLDGIGALLSTVLALVVPVGAVSLQMFLESFLGEGVDLVVGALALLGAEDQSRLAGGSVLVQRRDSSLPLAAAVRGIALDWKSQSTSLTCDKEFDSTLGAIPSH